VPKCAKAGKSDDSLINKEEREIQAKSTAD